MLLTVFMALDLILYGTELVLMHELCCMTRSVTKPKR